MGDNSVSNDSNAKSAYGLTYVTEDRDWSGNTTYRDVTGKVVGTKGTDGVYRRPDGSRTWNGNDSEGGK